MATKKCGYIAVVGRPNVGKSTLINAILGQKISITSNKPSTTRDNILGIKTVANCQAIYIDTPGISKKYKSNLNHRLSANALDALDSVSIILFVVEALTWTESDYLVLNEIQKRSVKIILLINKIDKIKTYEAKKALDDFAEELSNRFHFYQVHKVSAKNYRDVEKINAVILANLPEGDFVFPDDYITDKSVRFLASEIIREKLIRSLGQEIPHNLFVDIETFDENSKMVKISAVIYVQRPGQKAIVIGHNGQKIKDIGIKARYDIEKLLENKKVYLNLWVKVRKEAELMNVVNKK